MNPRIARTTTRKSGVNPPPFAAHGFWRMLILLLAFGMFVVLLIGRLATLALFESTRAYGATSTEYVPERGDIVDRNGIPLARSIYGYAIWVKPEDILGDRKQLASQLAEIFPDTPASEFYAKLTAGKPGYLRKRALPEQVRQVHSLGEVAIEFPREATRLYPQHDMAAHVLGFVNRDGKGAMGMERVMNDYLRDPSKRSAPLNLALDVRVQAALESELASGMAATTAMGAAGVVLDVQTGEVIAMATLPSFNPNRPSFANIPDLGENIVDGRYPISRQTNNVTNRVYELGSTFKPLTVAAAMDAGTVRDLSVRYDATKPLQVGKFKIRDSHPLGRWMNAPESLIHSSNIVTAQIADNLGAAHMDAMLRTMHFNARPDIELAEKAMPLYPKKWDRLKNMTVGYGHGIAVTPLHLASAYAAMVNGGIYRPATMFKTKPGAKIPGKRVFKAATSARMRQMMRMIVKDGTGKQAEALGYRVGGKTGSAEKPGVGGYSRNLVVATFASAFPMDNPRYIVVAMLDEPKGTEASSFQRTAGYTAAPVVRKTVTRIGPLLGIIPDMKRDVDVSELMPLLWKAKGEQ